MTYQFRLREEPFDFSYEFDDSENGLLESDPGLEPEFDELETEFAAVRATSPRATEFDFEWENFDDEFTDANGTSEAGTEWFESEWEEGLAPEISKPSGGAEAKRKSLGELSYEDEWSYEGGGQAPALCGPYEPGEVQRSNTEAGLLPADFLTGPGGYFLIADFAVASSAIKSSVRNDASLRSWLNQTLQSAAKDPSLKIRLVGYSDCANKEYRNTALRAARAKQVMRLIDFLAGKNPKWPVLRKRFTHGPAPVDQYLVDNSSAKNRATNRGVSLELTRVMNVEPLAVNCKADFIHRAIGLLQTARARQLMGVARSSRLLHVMRVMNDKTVDDRYLMETDINAIARSGFMGLKWRRVSIYLDDVCRSADQKDTPITDDEVLHTLWRLDNAIMNGLCRAAELSQKKPATAAGIGRQAGINAAHATILALTRNVKSVYFGYQKAAAECKTRSKTIIIPPKKKKDPRIRAPKVTIPTPKNQTIPTDDSIWDELRRIAKMSGILLSAAVLLIPGGFVARAVAAARAVFLLKGFTPKQLIGMASEKAAQVIAEWTLSKLGISPSKMFDLNSIRINFPGIDLITPVSPISVKAYGILSQYVGDELEKRVISKYLSDFLRLTGFENYQEAYRDGVAESIRQVKGRISPVGTLPSALRGNVSTETIKKYIRENTIFMIPDDHVLPVHRYSGSRLLAYYKQFGLPGITSGLSDNAVAPRISKMLADRFKSIGVKSTDLQLMLKAAQK